MPDLQFALPGQQFLSGQNGPDADTQLRGELTHRRESSAREHLLAHTFPDLFRNSLCEPLSLLGHMSSAYSFD
jgi:hypothetical protein